MSKIRQKKLSRRQLQQLSDWKSGKRSGKTTYLDKYKEEKLYDESRFSAIIIMIVGLLILLANIYFFFTENFLLIFLFPILFGVVLIITGFICFNTTSPKVLAINGVAIIFISGYAFSTSILIAIMYISSGLYMIKGAINLMRKEKSLGCSKEKMEAEFRD